MPKQPKKRKPGRPRLGEQAKGKITPVRFTDAEYQRIATAAQNAKQTVSHWIRSTLNAAVGA